MTVGNLQYVTKFQGWKWSCERPQLTDGTKIMGLDKILSALTFTYLLPSCRKIGLGTLSNSY